MKNFVPYMMEFNEVEDTGLLWMYILHTPNRCKKLTHNDRLWKTHSLIVIVLIISRIETNPGEFL